MNKKHFQALDFISPAKLIRMTTLEIRVESDMFILISLPLYSDYVQTNIQFSSSRQYKRPVYSAARAVLSACHLFFGPQKTLAQDTGTLTDNIGKV